MVTVSRNTVHSVFFLILVFVSVSVLFIMIGAEFLGMIMLIVYVGAVAVLFLFVVMMLNISEQTTKHLKRKGLIKKKGFSPVETISGMSLFHSSYMPVIKKYSYKYDVDPRELIIAVCKISRSDAKEKIVEREAKKLKKKGYTGNWKKLYGNYYGQEQKKY